MRLPAFAAAAVLPRTTMSAMRSARPPRDRFEPAVPRRRKLRAPASNALYATPRTRRVLSRAGGPKIRQDESGARIVRDFFQHRCARGGQSTDGHFGRAADLRPAQAPAGASVAGTCRANRARRPPPGQVFIRAVGRLFFGRYAGLCPAPARRGGLEAPHAARIRGSGRDRGLLRHDHHGRRQQLGHTGRVRGGRQVQARGRLRGVLRDGQQAGPAGLEGARRGRRALTPSAGRRCRRTGKARFRKADTDGLEAEALEPHPINAERRRASRGRPAAL